MVNILHYFIQSLNIVLRLIPDDCSSKYVPRAVKVTVMPTAEARSIFFRLKPRWTKRTPKRTPIRPAMATPTAAQSAVGSDWRPSSIVMSLVSLYKYICLSDNNHFSKTVKNYNKHAYSYFKADTIDYWLLCHFY